MKRLPDYTWDQETGIATCRYIDKFNREFTGTAVCHPEDEDIKSWRSGYTIAEYRTRIALAKAKNNDAKIAYEAVRQIYYSIKHSKNYNDDSYEAKMIKHQLKLRQEEVAQTKSDYKLLKADFRLYMRKKDELNQKYREQKDSQLDKN